MMPHPGRQTATLRQLHDQFLTEQRYATRLAPATLEAYRVSFELLLALMPELTPEDLTPEAMTEFFRRIETRPRLVGRREVAGVTASTVATHRGKLGRFFSWLAGKGYLASNPFAAMPYPRVNYDDRQYLAKEDVEKIMAALALGGRTRFQRRRDLALIATLLYAGLRRGELLGLRIGDVNIDRREMLVRAATSKSRSSRVVPTSSALCQALEDYLAERRKLPLTTPQLFVSGAGEPLTLHGLKHLTERIASRSCVRFHLHQFRHTFAINFLHQSGDVAKLQQLLGHRDIRMTSGYLRVLPTAAMRGNIESVRLDTLL